MDKINSEDRAVYKVARVEHKSLSGMSDSELLASVSGQSLEYCRKALNEAGSLRELSAEIDDNKYAPLIAGSLELANRWLHETVERGDALISPKSVRGFLQLELKDEPAEVFCVLFLDNRNRVIKFERLFNGTIDGASIYPREVVRACIKHNSAAVIFCHNHPSGTPEPSMADEQITSRLKDALSLIDVRVLDHIIIGDTVVSFAERGLI